MTLRKAGDELLSGGQAGASLSGTGTLVSVRSGYHIQECGVALDAPTISCITSPSADPTTWLKKRSLHLRR